jgi:hypothetical protein
MFGTRPDPVLRYPEERRTAVQENVPEHSCQPDLCAGVFRKKAGRDLNIANRRR